MSIPSRRATDERTWPASSFSPSISLLYTEVWHYVFGYANLFLSESGLLADPYADGAPFRGFLPFLWAAPVDVSS